VSTEHSGDCTSGAGHRTIVLVVTVPEEHAQFTSDALALLKEGLAHPGTVYVEDRACTYFGPFFVEGADRALVYALGGEAEGHHEYWAKDPEMVREHTILTAVRGLVEMARSGAFNAGLEPSRAAEAAMAQ